ncbi:MAG: response regulator [Verrucomicrobia bacterium]|nr:response regulator [Verrucomicrobiota bacterium]
MKNPKPILLIEDDKADVMTVKRALKECHASNQLFVVGNGEDALSFLRDERNPRPGFILLDLNMPKMGGIEFLEIVKHDDALKHIPVVVLTTSRQESERIESFQLGVAGYVIKPMNYHQFIDMVRAITHYWSISEVGD